jgi:CspA family cold shock protein
LITGTVKWFNNSKDYGFVTLSDSSGYIFMHYSSIEGENFKSLREGQSVNPDLGKGPKGLQATRASV